MPDKISGSAIKSGTITSTQFSSSLYNSISSGGPKITSLLYPSNDFADPDGNVTIILNGSGFDPNVVIYINGNAVPSVSFISSSNVQFTTPALSPNLYLVYAINPDGGYAIKVPGLNVALSFTATGGTVTDVGGYRYHTFTSSGTFEPTFGSAEVEYLIVAGGGGGGDRHGGGGGAGGYIEGNTTVSFGNTYTVTIGAGGIAGSYEAGGTSPQGSGGHGSNSSISLIDTAIGGGGGGTYDGNPTGTFGSGGGGGGASRPGIAGTAGQGNSGGSGSSPGGGGGGGAGAAGGNADNGSGGDGKQWLDGNYYAGGGGGGWGASGGPATPGGQGGGGAGAWDEATISAGTVNTGGGGGGTRSASVSSVGRAGGSGIVIIRYSI